MWALACNVLLFALMGRIVVASFRANELFARVERQLASVNLLRPHFGKQIFEVAAISG